jgi:hypothetical protein
MPKKKADPFEGMIGLDRVKTPTYKLMKKIWSALPAGHPDKKRGGFDIYMREGWCLRFLSRYSYIIFDFNEKEITLAGASASIKNGDLLTALLKLVRTLQKEDG